MGLYKMSTKKVLVKIHRMISKTLFSGNLNPHSRRYLVVLHTDHPVFIHGELSRVLDSGAYCVAYTERSGLSSAERYTLWHTQWWFYHVLF